MPPTALLFPSDIALTVAYTAIICIHRGRLTSVYC